MGMYDWRPKKGKRRQSSTQPSEEGGAKRRKPKLKKQRPLKRGKSVSMRERMESAASIGLPRLTPRQTMPSSAKQRRFRTRFQPVRAFTFNVRDIMTSTRWFSLGLLLACVYAIYLMGSNPRFYLNNIVVEGVNVIPSTDILTASGLQGAHIFAVEPEGAAESIDSLPGILEAEVELQWPDSFRIMVREDTPVITWREAGREYWVNADGALVPAFGQSFDLLQIDAVVPANVPSSAVIPEPVLDADGNPVEQLPQTYLDFVPADVMKGALQLQQLYPDLQALTYAPSGGLRFDDARGFSARFGTGEDMHVKAAIYEALIAQLAADGMTPEYINVANIEKPVYKEAFGQ